MEKICCIVMTTCYAALVGWVVWAGIGWTAGLVVTVILLAAVLYFMYKEPMAISELRSSLLLDLGYICLGAAFLLNSSKEGVPEELYPLSVIVLLIGAADAIYWSLTIKGSGKSLKTILKEELRIPPLVELVIVSCWFDDSIRTKDFGEPWVWAVIAVLIFDFVRQESGRFKRKNHKNTHMQQILKNDVLTVLVKEHGAELSSIKKGSTEYLWQADPAFWGRHSPVLFPIVGSVWDKKYRVAGKEFELGQHGFARDMDFTLISASDTEVRYCLMSNEETLKKYPWRFALEIGYRLHGNKIDVIWEVKNIGDEDMYFQIGAHPAFCYPDYDPEKPERGYLSFDKPEGLECIRIKEKGCVDAETKYPLEVPQDGLMPLTRETFDVIDTIMLQDSQIGKVILHRKDRTPWLALSFDAPVVGIWSPPTKNAPFICLEPWYGRCDRVGYTGDYREKDWINRLAAGEKFSSVYTIEIL